MNFAGTQGTHMGFMMAGSPKKSKTEFPSPSQKKDLQYVFDLLEAIRTIQPNISVQLVQTLLLVALKEGSGTTELQQGTQWRLSTVSRHLLDLGPRDRHGDAGLGLVDRRDKPEDTRRNEYRLTAKGREIIARILKTYNQAQDD